jgi:hypothetical protein
MNVPYRFAAAQQEPRPGFDYRVAGPLGGRPRSAQAQ